MLWYSAEAKYRRCSFYLWKGLWKADGPIECKVTVRTVIALFVFYS